MSRASETSVTITSVPIMGVPEGAGIERVAEKYLRRNNGRKRKS